MNIAKEVAKWSKDPTTKVGAIAVGANNSIIGEGYNGIPRGVQDLPSRMERPSKYLWTSHAEENLIAHAAMSGVSLKGCTVFVTHYPCSRCARLLINSGVSVVYHGAGITSMPSDEFQVASTMLMEAEVRSIFIAD